MKKVRILPLIMAVLIAALPLIGCEKEAVPAVTFRDTVITENEYCYYLSQYKGTFLKTVGATEDNPAYWSQSLGDGVTVGDYVGVLAANEVMKYAVLLQLFSDYGLVLSNDEINAVDSAMNAYVTSAGSKSALNSILSAYGVDYGMLRDIKLDSIKLAKVQNYMFGDGKIIVASDEDMESHFKENYFRAKYIFISNQKDYVYNEDGSFAMNEDGSYKTRDITEAEKLEKAALFEDIQARITAGEDFETLLKEYTMDVGMLHFADGYYFTSTSSYIEAQLRAALIEAEIGEPIRVETDAGWYLAKRYELEDGAWQKEENAAMFQGLEAAVKTLELQEFVFDYAKDVITIDESIVDAYPLAYCTANFNY